MNKFLLYFLALGMTFSITSCGNDDIDPDVTGDLEINFRLTYNDQALVMGDRITYPGGNELVVTRYSFFMMDAELRADDAENGLTRLEDAYVNLTDAHANADLATQGLTLRVNGIPAGSYETLSYNQGVNAEDNAKTPADFPAGSVLASTNEFWNNWNSYVFVKMEGRYDANGDGELSEDEGVAFHLGGDPAFRTVNIGTEGSELVNVEEGEVTTLSLEIELENLFTQNGTTHDIVATPRTHMPATQEEINFLATGAMNAIKMVQ